MPLSKCRMYSPPSDSYGMPPHTIAHSSRGFAAKITTTSSSTRTWEYRYLNKFSSPYFFVNVEPHQVWNLVCLILPQKVLTSYYSNLYHEIATLEYKKILVALSISLSRFVLLFGLLNSTWFPFWRSFRWWESQAARSLFRYCFWSSSLQRQKKSLAGHFLHFRPILVRFNCIEHSCEANLSWSLPSRDWTFILTICSLEVKIGSFFLGDVQSGDGSSI